jgi:hypothetical protein
MVEQSSSLAVIKQKGALRAPLFADSTVMNGFGNFTDVTLPFADKEEYQFCVPAFWGSVGP